MGFIHEEHGRVTVETRGESLKVHLDYPTSGDEVGTTGWYYQEGAHHPEFDYRDVLDLLDALHAPRVRERWDNEETRQQRGWRPPTAVIAREVVAGQVERRLGINWSDDERREFVECMDAALRAGIEHAHRARRPLGFGDRARVWSLVIDTLTRALLDVNASRRNG